MMTTKVMVSFPDEFLEEVDRTAQEEHRSRSELVREALRLYMGLRQEQRLRGLAPLVRQAVMVQDRISTAAPGSGEDSTADIRRWREARG
jgi:CopG family transcriptional regulator/antitoxin EndoAI